MEPIFCVGTTPPHRPVHPPCPPGPLFSVLRTVVRSTPLVVPDKLRVLRTGPTTIRANKGHLRTGPTTIVAICGGGSHRSKQYALTRTVIKKEAGES